MLVHFPDLDTLRLAITSGLVPAEVVAGPASFSNSTEGVVVDSPSKFLKKTLSELKKLGVTEGKHHVGDVTEVSCWPQILPAFKNSTPPQLSTQAPVLFELPSEAALSDVVSELLRLGNDRQSFRWLVGGRVLLRVIGPPYYTLLRALDRATVGGDAGVRAFAETTPRVWIEFGFTHPLADRIAVAEGQTLLVHAPRDWEYLADEPFRDVYELLNLQLPAAKVDHADAGPRAKLSVPVKLIPGNAADQPEFWVLNGDPLERLDAFVRDADDRLVQRLRFAVAVAPDGKQSAILRHRSLSKLAPPTLALSGVTGFRAYWKLPNLFVPSGTRLHPPLRRDAVRTLLAPDPDAVVWLTPDANGFVPRSIPDAAFRKLEEWVEYVIDREREPLAAWVAGTSFDFDSFVCSESMIKPPPETPPRERKPDRPERAKNEPPAKEAEPEVVKAGSAKYVPPTEPKATPPSEWKVKRAKLEQSFLAIEGSLDNAERIKLWPELAWANAGAGDAAEAAVCWSHALWKSEAPPADWAESWALAEIPKVTFPITEAVFDARLALADPTQAEARQFAAVLLAAATEKPKWLKTKLPAARAFLDAHDAKLPARPAWLAAVALATLSGSDVLGLARSRDRLLQRLLDTGLNPDRDLPAFLRFAGGDDADRMREVREKADELYRLVKSWLFASLTDATKDTTATPAYADLLFAYAFAKFGDVTRANELMKAAKGVLAGPVPRNAAPHWAISSNILFRAFTARVEQILAGVPPVGPFPPDVVEDLAAAFTRAGLDKRGQVVTNKSDGDGFYAIARLRERSWILDPQEAVDAKSTWTVHADEVKKQLAALPTLRPDLLPREVRRLLAGGVGARPIQEVRFDVLHAALPLAIRAGESFTLELIKQVPDAMTGATGNADDTAKRQGQLLERSLYFAGHFGHADLVRQLIDRFLTLVAAQKEEAGITKLINAATGIGLRSLRKLGQKDAVDHLLQRLLAEVTKGESVEKLRPKYALRLPLWYEILQALLRLAGGWLTFGLIDKASPIVAEARSNLLSAAPPNFPGNSTSDLTRAYVAALGQGPASFGLPRLQELFRTMPPNRILNSWTTGPVYSLNHFLVIEEVVLALTGDDFAIGPTGKKWLDEDEYLVRQRVHADVRRLLKGTGL